ncbi:MAG TPA: hypothetical protein VFE33_10435 [Thermoanaerobaculia bacterium]|nr:hypothetical protein [Thermoanaerobaculia bacterium]
MAVAGKVHEMLPATAEMGERRSARHPFERLEAGDGDAVLARQGADVALVEPGGRLLGEDAGQPFAVEVDPLIARAVGARRQVLDAVARYPRTVASIVASE